MVPMLSTFLDFTVNSITHATGCSAGITIAWVGMSLGGALAAISGFRLLRDWHTAWVSVTGQLTSCSVEVFPPLFLSRRKFVQITYVYRYAAGGQSHEGTQTVVEKQEAYFDPRKRAREIMARSEIEIFHDERQPSRSRFRMTGRRRAKLNITMGPGGVRSRLFSRLRIFSGAKVALVTGLGIAVLSAAALLLGKSPENPAAGVRLSGAPARLNPAGAVGANVPETTGTDTPGRLSRAATEKQAAASSLASRRR